MENLNFKELPNHLCSRHLYSSVACVQLNSKCPFCFIWMSCTLMRTVFDRQISVAECFIFLFFPPDLIGFFMTSTLTPTGKSCRSPSVLDASKNLWVHYWKHCVSDAFINWRKISHWCIINQNLPIKLLFLLYLYLQSSYELFLEAPNSYMATEYRHISHIWLFTWF